MNIGVPEDILRKELGLTKTQFNIRKMEIRSELIDAESKILKKMGLKKEPKIGTKKYDEFRERLIIEIANCYRKRYGMFPYEKFVEEKETVIPVFDFLKKKEYRCKKCGQLLDPEKDENTGKTVYYCDDCDLFMEEEPLIEKGNISIKQLEQMSKVTDPKILSRIDRFRKKLVELGLKPEMDFTDKYLEQLANTYRTEKEIAPEILRRFWTSIFPGGKFDYIRLGNFESVFGYKKDNIPVDEYAISLAISFFNENPGTKDAYEILRNELNEKGIVEGYHLPKEYLAMFEWIVNSEKGISNKRDIMSKYKVGDKSLQQIKKILVTNGIVREEGRGIPKFSETFKDKIKLRLNKNSFGRRKVKRVKRVTKKK